MANPSAALSVAYTGPLVEIDGRKLVQFARSDVYVPMSLYEFDAEEIPAIEGLIATAIADGVLRVPDGIEIVVICDTSPQQAPGLTFLLQFASLGAHRRGLMLTGGFVSSERFAESLAERSEPDRRYHAPDRESAIAELLAVAAEAINRPLRIASADSSREVARRG